MSKSPKTVHLEFMPAGSQGESLRVDREKNILFGAQVCKLGEAKGHGFALDQTSLDQLVSLASPKGVKARFGHPSLCSPALGTYLGRHHNFFQDGDYVRADLHFSDAADSEKVEHVMAMAELEPDMIGQSVCISCELEELEDSPFKDESGEPLPVARISHFSACDVVDQGAATDAMFAEPIEGVEFSNRSMVEFKNALKIPGFLERVLSLIPGVGHTALDPEAAGTEVSERKEVEMTLTLSDFKAKHPEVAKEHASELSAAHQEALESAIATGVEQERARVTKVLSKCEPHHFAASAEHPEGFVAYALSEGISYEECLEGILELNTKNHELTSLQKGDSELDGIASCDPPQAELSDEAAAAASLEAARKRREAN